MAISFVFLAFAPLFSFCESCVAQAGLAGVLAFADATRRPPQSSPAGRFSCIGSWPIPAMDSGLLRSSTTTAMCCALGEQWRSSSSFGKGHPPVSCDLVRLATRIVLVQSPAIPRGGHLYDDKEKSPGDHGRLYPAGSRTLSDSQRVAGRALCGERNAVANAERHAASSVGDSPGQPHLCCRSGLDLCTRHRTQIVAGTGYPFWGPSGPDHCCPAIDGRVLHLSHSCRACGRLDHRRRPARGAARGCRGRHLPPKNNAVATQAITIRPAARDSHTGISQGAVRTTCRIVKELALTCRLG